MPSPGDGESGARARLAALRLLSSLRPCRTFRGPAFDRFDATLSRVENTPDLTLPDLVRRRTSIRCDILSQLGLEIALHRKPPPLETRPAVSGPLLGATAPTNADVCPR
jgi:hypothetical protein